MIILTQVVLGNYIILPIVNKKREFEQTSFIKWYTGKIVLKEFVLFTPLC